MINKITALKVQKRNPNRVNVYIDGQFVFGLSKIVAGWLQIGQELDEEKINSLKEKDAEQVFYQKTLNLLNYRSRTEKEITEKLKSYGCEKSQISTIIERLKLNGLLDDKSFANNWAENRSSLRPRSHRLLSYELRQKGIQEDHIQEALINLEDDGVLAYRAGFNYSRRLHDLEWADFQKKMMSHLGRKGFSYEVARNTVRMIWDEKREME